MLLNASNKFMDKDCIRKFITVMIYLLYKYET